MLKKQKIIAHRGASGYLPEHSMESKAMAYAMGADFIEQDVVMSKDDHLLVLHDHFLDNISNVADCFPTRSRDDGHYYVIDFTLAEIQSLTISEIFDIDEEGTKTARYKGRFPLNTGQFRVHTLQQEIEFIQGLNKSTQQNIGIYTEIKSPFFHLQHGKDLALAVLNVLKEYGYHHRDHNVYLQCFDHDCLKRIKHELLPALEIDLKLVQLVGETDWLETAYWDNGVIKNYDYGWMHQADGMEIIAQYADAIGPWFPQLINETQEAPFYQKNILASAAHEVGLFVHPYTFRKEELPTYAENFEQFLDIFLNEVEVDGLFTDFPDIAVNFLKGKSNQ